jgi:hypothetical protein
VSDASICRTIALDFAHQRLKVISWKEAIYEDIMPIRISCGISLKDRGPEPFQTANLSKEGGQHG